MSRSDTTIRSDERFDALRARLEADLADLLAQMQVSAGDPNVTATTGQGETEHIVGEIEERVQAVLDAAASARVAELDDAIRRIDDGTYGSCTRCGDAIGAERLEALPQVRYCIRCQRDDEGDRRARRRR
jgi:DnaK suppressor protein